MMDYGTENAEPQEIDEFAMFRARAHGMESEYLEMARVRGRGGTSGGRGHSKGSRGLQEKQKSLDRHSMGEADQSPKLIGRKLEHRRTHRERENGDTDETHVRHARSRPGSFKHSEQRHLNGSAELLSQNSMQRTLSCRSKREFTSGPQYADEGLSNSADFESFNRHRTKTVPPKKQGRLGVNGEAESPQGEDEEGQNDRSVLRVRNFSTKTGNLVNRGDSIKIRNRGEGRNTRSGGEGGEWSGRGGPSRDMRRSLDDEEPSGARTSGSRNNNRTSRQSSESADQDYGGITSNQDVKVLMDGNHRTGEEGHSTVRKQAKVMIHRNDHEDDMGAIYKVLVLGSQGVGKTTLTEQLLTSEYLPNSQNYADEDCSEKIVSVQVDDEESLLQFIDSPANSQMLKSKEAVDAHIVVYSLTDRSSFLYAQTCLQELRPAKRHNVVILVGNKQDIVRNRCINEDEGRNLATKKQCKFTEVSALLDHRVDELLVGITRQIRLRKRKGPAVAPANPGADSNGLADGPGGCMQRLALKAFRKLFPQRIMDSACDDLYSP